MDVVLDAGWLTDPDCNTVEALARLQLAARRRGRRIVLRAPTAQLRRLIESAGLAGALPWIEDDPPSGLQPFG